MATLQATYESPEFPPAADDFSSMQKHRVVHTAFGDMPLSWRFWFRRSWLKWWALLFVICILVILMTVYHHDIVRWLEPWAQKIRALPGGWAIPIGILFIISFPPLFGHEIVTILCGLVWGLWVGFAIVAVGTMLGEWGTFFAFRYWLQNKARKLEARDINFACMTRLVERGGFWTVFLARLSAIPGHLTTAVFATTRITLFVFTAAALLTMPKQLMVVYLGTIFNQEEQGTRSTASKIVTDVVLVFSFLVTIGVAVYLYREMAKVRPQILAERKLKAQEAGDLGDSPELDAYTSDVSGYRSKRGDGSDEHLALAKNAISPAGYSLPYNHLPYSQSHFDVSRTSFENAYDPRHPWEGEAPTIVVQAPSERAGLREGVPDPTLAGRPPPSYRTYSPQPRGQQVEHGQAI